MKHTDYIEAEQALHNLRKTMAQERQRPTTRRASSMAEAEAKAEAIGTDAGHSAKVRSDCLTGGAGARAECNQWSVCG